MKNCNIILNGWEYNYSDSNGFSIKPRGKSYSVPKLLSKYYSLSCYSIDAFEKQSLFVSQLDRLNDLFETIYFYRPYEKLTVTEMEDILDIDYPVWRNIIDIKEEFSDLYQNFNVFKRKHHETQCFKFLRSRGVLCLTEKTENELIWSHYTNNKGFLIQFKTAVLQTLGAGPYPINYLHEPLELDIKASGSLLYWTIMGLTKKEAWMYENEFRMYFAPKSGHSFEMEGLFKNTEREFETVKQPRLIEYSREAINKVLLGFNFYSPFEDKMWRDNGDRKRGYMTFTNEYKARLFNKLIETGVPVEKIFIDPKRRVLLTIPISITKVDHDTFFVEEHR